MSKNRPTLFAKHTKVLGTRVNNAGNTIEVKFVEFKDGMCSLLRTIDFEKHSSVQAISLTPEMMDVLFEVLLALRIEKVDFVEGLAERLSNFV